VPVLVLVGEINHKPWVVGDEVKPWPVLPITATIDHRWVDGYGIAGMSETFRKYLANPMAYEE
jgi:pyruvate dehydrogenase E2 component (dihydrolipoamide acetyltransferase)